MLIDNLRNSGLLELYVLQDLDEHENKIVESALLSYPALKQDLHDIELALQLYAYAHATPPPPTVKPMMLATIDYTERMENGEKPTNPPALHALSKISDFEPWLNRDDMQEPDEYDAMHGKIIGASEEKTTLIVWLRYGAPDETHTEEYEKFLIVEGSCDITIGEKVHHLKAGDFLSIPLHINHRVEVTSDKPCKIILERAAA